MGKNRPVSLIFSFISIQGTDGCTTIFRLGDKYQQWCLQSLLLVDFRRNLLVAMHGQNAIHVDKIDAHTAKWC